MTEKRFKIDLDEEAITDNGEYCLSLYCFQDKGEKDVCGLLNELAEENEQLKQFKSKVLELLDEKIKHYEHKPFSAPISQPMSVNFDADMDRLARLSELELLKEELQE